MKQMKMSMQLIAFTTCFGNNKAEKQNLILLFSLTEGNTMIVIVKKQSVLIFGLVYEGKVWKVDSDMHYVFLFDILECQYMYKVLCCTYMQIIAMYFIIT